MPNWKFYCFIVVDRYCSMYSVQCDLLSCTWLSQCLVKLSNNKKNESWVGLELSNECKIVPKFLTVPTFDVYSTFSWGTCLWQSSHDCCPTASPWDVLLCSTVWMFINLLITSFRLLDLDKRSDHYTTAHQLNSSMNWCLLINWTLSTQRLWVVMSHLPIIYLLSL